jgi:hypothetical protein
VSEDVLLGLLPVLTGGLFALGAGMSALAWARGKAPLAGVTTLFAFGLGRQIALSFDSELARLVADGAIFGMGCAGIVALRAVRRTTHERNRAEDLHWDAMETVRTLTELASGAGSDLSAKLAKVLALGVSRFGLERAAAWRADEDGGRILATHPPPEHREGEPPAVPVERLEQAARAGRPLVLVDAKPAPTAVFFGAAVRSGDRVWGSLGFAGARAPESRFAATDKDLISLMAQWLAIELEREGRGARRESELATRDAPEIAAPERARPAAEPEAGAPAASPTLRPGRRGGDLNAAIRRSEAKLKRRIGVDASLELALATSLPRTRAGSISLPALIESLVVAAVRLAPDGRIRVETADAGDVTLAVRVEGSGLDEAALARVFEGPNGGDPGGGGALPLAQLERLLRHGGGDLSVSLEPPRRVTLTAFVPAQANESAKPTDARAPQSSR